MKNRYVGILEEQNQDLCPLSGADSFIRFVVAKEVGKAVENRKSPKIIDLGTGEGDSARPIFELNPGLFLELLDESSIMIDKAEKSLTKFKDRFKTIVKDANEYLQSHKDYDLITTSWTVHNFVQEDKTKLYKSIYKALKPGGIFIMMDKVYPDDSSEARKMLDHQLDRYKKYLAGDLQQAILEHEEQDFLDKYIMTESVVNQDLMSAGFNSVELVDRLERDVVYHAIK